MTNLTKKVLIIIAIVMIMGLIAAIPGFAETQDELRQIFVTRDEVNFWINGSGTATGISEVLANLEIGLQEQVQSKVKVEMSKRGINDKAESSTTASP